MRRALDERLPIYYCTVCFFLVAYSVRIAQQIGQGQATLAQASALGTIYGSDTFRPDHMDNVEWITLQLYD